MLGKFLFHCVLLLGLWLGGPAAAADMFGRPESPPDAPPPAAALPELPAPLRTLIGRSLAIQSRLNAELRGQLREARRDDSWRPALAITMISFLYGVFHAIGPGHGKIVVGSYFLTRRARLLHGIAMSGAAALIQALSAVLLVTLAAALWEMGSGQLLSYAADLETASYGVISLIGLWLAWGVLRPRPCCGHAHEPGHDHHRQPAEAPNLLRVLATGGAVGLRPCSGAILVLLFTLANDIYPIGILATFAMGLGVAITVSAVSLASFGVHRSLSGLSHHGHAAANRLRQAVAMAGAVFITLFGLLQLLGIWSGVITPMAG